MLLLTLLIKEQAFSWGFFFFTIQPLERASKWRQKYFLYGAMWFGQFWKEKLVSCGLGVADMKWLLDRIFAAVLFTLAWHRWSAELAEAVTHFFSIYVELDAVS